MKKLQVVFLAVMFCCAASAQHATSTNNSATIVPRLMRFSGQLRGTTGTVGITFSLHAGEDDNVALWTETQNVKLDENGRYTVLLGITKEEGVPAELFADQGAQWLGIQVEGRVEQPRVLLVSVPYALRAAEADTLAGHAASEFVTSDKVTTLVKEQVQAAASEPATNGKQSPVSRGTTPTPQGPTQFTGNTTNNVVSVVQSGAGTGLTAIAPGTAVYGDSTNTSGNAYGVKGTTASASGFGVYGLNTATTGSAVGIYGQSSSIGGVALSGVETSTTGITKGVVATVNSPSGIGAVFQNTATGGKILSGQAGSAHTEVFSVDGGGNVNGVAFIGDGSQLTKLHTVQKLWLPAGNCFASTAYPLWADVFAAPSVVCRSDGANQEAVIDFPASSFTAVETHWRIPANWDGQFQVEVKWFAPSATGTSQFDSATYCIADGSSDTLGASGTGGISIFAPDNNFQTTTLVVYNNTKCHPGDVMVLWIGVSSGAMDVDMVGAEISYGVIN